MNENNHENQLRSLIGQVIAEYLDTERTRAEPVLKTELVEERKRREQLERRVNELIEENAKSRAAAEEAERQAAIRSELQRHGILKLDLGFKALKDDIHRADDGRLVGRNSSGEMELKDYISQFVRENPELLPARNVGGSGSGVTQRHAGPSGSGLDLDSIKPGMSREDLESMRREIARIASQTLRGC